MNTIYEFATHAISEAQTSIQSLAEREQLEEQARKNKDRNARQKARKQIENIHRQLLEQADASIIYTYLSTTQEANADDFRYAWQKDLLGKQDTPTRQLQEWKLERFYKNYWEQPNINLTPLPPCSFFLRFTFTLAKPYISKDDNPFYIIDNPIVRDKVFRLPMVRPTSWKGNLYSALWQLGHNKQNDESIQRLFGEIRSEESGKAGRLFFFPTFFAQTSLEIINPHDRKRRVGKKPILFESVPAGAQGTFSLLYVPFDLIGQDEAKTRTQAAEDLRLVAEGISAMMLTYGFSAKRTSGFGVAQEKVSDGFVQIRIEEAQTPPASAPTATEPPLPKYLQSPGKLKDEYLNPDGTFREHSQAELAKMTKAQKQEYEKAQKWWEREGKALAGQPPAQVEAEAPAEAPKPTWPKCEFDSFAQLVENVEALHKGGGQ